MIILANCLPNSVNSIFRHSLLFSVTTIPYELVSESNLLSFFIRPLETNL